VISSGVYNRYYWWSGYDLLRRLLLFAVYVLVEDFYSDYTQVCTKTFKKGSGMIMATYMHSSCNLSELKYILSGPALAFLRP